MSAASPEERLRALQKLAAEFSEPSSIGVDLTWSNDFSHAGVTTNDEGAEVFLNAASAPVNTMAEAAETLRKIFADEIVCVTAKEKGAVVLCALAPASDPSGGFNRLDRSALSADMPMIDEVVIERWSDGLVEQPE